MRRRALLLGAGALAARPGHATGGPTVLELFTSQGCSSCPPADALLGSLSGEPGVIALAWHVDYWNGPGWHDPYADAAWTARQRRYAMRLGEEVFTPALVVNGATMVVGSDPDAVHAAIKTAPALPVIVPLRRDGASVRAALELPAGATLLRVLYLPQAATGVRGGENAGRRLTEYRIVRDAAPVSSTGSVLTLSDTPPGHGVAVLVTDQSGRLIGAGDLPPA
jgi:hypothetical protein